MRTLARAGFAILCMLGARALAPAPTERDADMPPVLGRFNTSITFYASLDRLPINADMSAGDGTATAPAAPLELREGLFGKALLCGQASVSYAAAGNVDLARPGALAVWVSPQDWKREGETPSLFFVTVYGAGRKLMLGRMGVTANQELLFAHAEAGNHRASALSGHTLEWQSGGWHLLVLNWRAEALEFSVDGGELQRAGAPWLSGAKGDPGGLIVGNEGTPDQQYLVDEVTVFDRPLSNEEIRWLFEQGAARK